VGFQVREATNGEQAVALWESWQPHLIWMDMRMPVMDGYEATRKIKNRQSRRAREQAGNASTNLSTSARFPVLASAGFPSPHSPTVIIALTASAFEEQREAILKAGCDDFIRKPFREDVLFEKMAAYLGVRYVYQEQAPSTSSQQEAKVERLTPDTLAAMPKKWLAQLHRAAEGCQDEEVLALLEQIPEQDAPLKLALIDLVDNFRFDLIVDLTAAFTNV
jgi:two-component system sensor histidine kinase/response regulator